MNTFCPVCQVIKTKKNTAPDKSKKSGFATYCRACDSDRQKAKRTGAPAPAKKAAEPTPAPKAKKADAKVTPKAKVPEPEPAADPVKAPEPAESLKHCRICGADKPLADFFADKTKPDGRRTNCAACDVARAKARKALALANV